MSAGWLRNLYEDLLGCNKGNEWESVFLRSWEGLKETRDFYTALMDRELENPEQIPQVTTDELWGLYSVSRVNDLMLLRFQNAPIEENGYLGPEITLENYVDFFHHIGFTTREITCYHPFNCEVVEVIQSDIWSVEIAEIKWPAIYLGNMLFSRAGVVVWAPESLLKKGVADQSTLYWSHRRNYRKTSDLSRGWGSNSQWSTKFRRDFEFVDRFVFNADGSNDSKHDAMPGLNAEERINFVRHRSLTTKSLQDGDLWPYEERVVEFKTR